MLTGKNFCCWRVFEVIKFYFIYKVTSSILEVEIRCLRKQELHHSPFQSTAKMSCGWLAGWLSKELARLAISLMLLSTDTAITLGQSWRFDSHLWWPLNQKPSSAPTPASSPNVQNEEEDVKNGDGNTGHWPLATLAPSIAGIPHRP